MLTYGFVKTKIAVVYAHGDNSELEIQLMWKSLFSDERWEPGKTSLIASFCRFSMIFNAVSSHISLAQKIITGQPSQMGIFATDIYAEDFAKDTCALLKIKGIPCEVFRELQPMLDWIGGEKEEPCEF